MRLGKKAGGGRHGKEERRGRKENRKGEGRRWGQDRVKKEGSVVEW